MKFYSAIVLVGLVAVVALGAPTAGPVQQVCERIVSAIKASGMLDMLESSASRMCDMLGDADAAQKCAEQVHKIAEDIRKEPAKEFCAKLPNQLEAARKCEKMCNFCKSMVQKIKDSGSLDQNRKNAENWCRILMDPVKVEQCKKSVDKFYDTLSKHTAEEACKEFDLCN